MFEELITKGENIIDSPHEKIMILKNEAKHGWNKTLAESEKIVNISKSYDTDLIKKSLINIVPEYIPAAQKKIIMIFSKRKIKKYKPALFSLKTLSIFLSLILVRSINQF